MKNYKEYQEDSEIIELALTTNDIVFSCDFKQIDLTIAINRMSSHLFKLKKKIEFESVLEILLIEICHINNIDPDLMYTTSRKSELVTVRRDYSYIATELIREGKTLDFYYNIISKYIHRDRSNVRFHHKVVAEWLGFDKKYTLDFNKKYGHLLKK